MNDTGRPPETARKASTTVLVREWEGRLQVYLLKRSLKSSFFPGSYVFPGGMVDSQDSDQALWARHVDMDMEAVDRRFGGGLSGEEGLVFGVAAVRETFEEAGVALAYPRGRGQEDLSGICSLRAAEKLGRGWLRDLALSGDWVLMLSRLSRWSHWITPKAMPKRFDTRFFVALMPSDQVCTPDRAETTEGIWIRPEEALRRNLEGEVPLSPPTLVTLQEFLPYRDLNELLKGAEDRPWGEPRLPRLVRLPQGPVIFEPWDPLWDEGVPADPNEAGTSVVPAGEPFSRLWYHEGIWRPIKA